MNEVDQLQSQGFSIWGELHSYTIEQLNQQLDKFNLILEIYDRPIYNQIWFRVIKK